MQNISLTYFAVIVLAALGVENAEQVADAGVIIIVALVALYGRYRAGGLRWFGIRD